MTWTRHGMILRWPAGEPFPEPADDELAEYGYYHAHHGTPAGYQRHVRRHERPCADCRAAIRRRSRERRQQHERGAA